MSHSVFLLPPLPQTPFNFLFSSVPKMDSGNRWATSAHCAGVVDLVLSGDISAQNGVVRLVVFRHVGSLVQRKCAVSALRFLAHNPDVWVARATRCALHDLFAEDSWRLFTQYRDAMAQVRLDYDEVVTDTGYQPSGVQRVSHYPECSSSAGDSSCPR